MVEVSGEVVIERAVEDVFDFVADERNRYDPRVRSAELISHGQADRCGFPLPHHERGHGSTCRDARRDHRVRTTAPAFLVTHVSGMDIHSTLGLDALDGATRLRWSSGLRPHGAFRLLTPILGLIGQRRSTAIWGGLKQTLEEQEDVP